MALDEIKPFVNSYLAIPLNHYLWMQDYKLYGQASCVFKTPKIYDELMNSILAANDNDAVFAESYAYAKQHNTLGLFFSKINGIDKSKVQQVTSISSFADDNTAVYEMLNNCERFFPVFYSDADMKAQFLSNDIRVNRLNPTKYVSSYLSKKLLSSNDLASFGYCLLGVITQSAANYIHEIDVNTGKWVTQDGWETGFKYTALNAAETIVWSASGPDTSAHTPKTLALNSIVHSFVNTPVSGKSFAQPAATRYCTLTSCTLFA